MCIHKTKLWSSKKREIITHLMRRNGNNTELNWTAMQCSKTCVQLLQKIWRGHTWTVFSSREIPSLFYRPSQFYLVSLVTKPFLLLSFFSFQLTWTWDRRRCLLFSDWWCWCDGCIWMPSILMMSSAAHVSLGVEAFSPSPVACF